MVFGGQQVGACKMWSTIGGMADSWRATISLRASAACPWTMLAPMPTAAKVRCQSSHPHVHFSSVERQEKVFRAKAKLQCCCAHRRPGSKGSGSTGGGTESECPWRTASEQVRHNQALCGLGHARARCRTGRPRPPQADGRADLHP